MSNELKSYLLDGSSGSTLTMVLREEIIAQKPLAKLEVLFEKEKDDTNTNSAHRKKVKTETDLAQINSSWENLRVQVQRRTEKARLITSNLKLVEELLSKLPPSNRAKIQPRFSRLCAEADIAISKISDD